MVSETRLQSLARDIWLVDGPMINVYSIPFTPRMTVIRLANGDLLLRSLVVYSPELAEELAVHDRVRNLGSANWRHCARIYGWPNALSGTIAWASPDARERAKSRDVAGQFDNDPGEDAASNWSDEPSQMTVHGSSAHTEVVSFRHASRTLILTNLIEKMDVRNLAIWQHPLAWLGRVLAPIGRMPLDKWLSFGRRRANLARALRRMLVWSPETAVIAHGDIFRENAAQRLRDGFRGLAPLGHA